MTATCVITNNYALQIVNIEHEADDEYAIIRELGLGNEHATTRNKIRYNAEGRAYVMKRCKHYFLDEFIRDNM